MAALSRKTPGQHHSLFAAIGILVSSDSTPYTDLNNLVTKLVMPEKTKNNMPQQSEIGRKLFHKFVDYRRRKSGKVHNEEAKSSDLKN